MNSDIIVRLFQAENRQAIHAIYYTTGFMGKPLDWYWLDFESLQISELVIDYLNSLNV